MHKKWKLSKLLKVASLPRATYYFELNKPDKDIKNKKNNGTNPEYFL